MSIRTIIFISMFIGLLSFVPNIANAECATAYGGTVYCSKYLGGGAAVGAAGQVKCVGGCERGKRSMCVEAE